MNCPELGKLARHETPNFDRYPRTRSADFTQTKASASPSVTHSRDPAKEPGQKT